MSDTSDRDKRDAALDEQMRLLESQYVFQEDEEVESFLRRYSFLVPFLTETSEHIKDFFPDAKIFLHTAYHANVEDGEELVAFISTRLEPRLAMDTLKQFYGGWWSQAVKAARGKIAIGLECI